MESQGTQTPIIGKLFCNMQVLLPWRLHDVIRMTLWSIKTNNSVNKKSNKISRWLYPVEN